LTQRRTFTKATAKEAA